MEINFSRINILLQAIADKDLDDIIAKKTYIPTLGNKYTKEELQAWLKTVSDFLVELKTSKDPEVIFDDIYDGLSWEDKLNVDKIETNDFEMATDDADKYDNLRKISLYKFVTEQ